MQGLGGLAPGLNRGATMSGNKPGGVVDPSPTKYDKLGPVGTGTPVSDSFTASKPGLYQFVAEGGGGEAGSGGSGGGGALGIVTKRLRQGDRVQILLAAGFEPGTTTLTFPDSSVATANGGKSGTNGSAGGIATGFDTNISGSPGGSGVPVGGAGGAFGPLGGGAHPAAGHGADNSGSGVGGFPMPGRVTINYVGA